MRKKAKRDTERANRRAWPRHGAPLCAAALFLGALGGLAPASGPARAAEPPAEQAPAISFMGIPVQPMSGTFLVLTDANVRDQPRTEGKRLAGLDEHERVEAVGRPEGAAWIAVRRDGEDLGFVFAPLLMPLIEAAQTEELEGRASLPDGAACRYTIRFAGMGAMEGEPYQSADYDLEWRCRRDGRAFDFHSLMFITEAPLGGPKSQTHQISVEFPQVAVGYDRVLATVVLYDRAKGEVRFDRVTGDDMGRKPTVAALPAPSVRDALLAAPAVAMSGWNADAWGRLSGAVPEPPMGPPEDEPPESDAEATAG